MAIELTRTIYKEKGTGKRFEIDYDKMKKDDTGPKTCRLPFVAEPDELYLYNDGWTDDGESYLLVKKKYLKGV